MKIRRTLICLTLGWFLAIGLGYLHAQPIPTAKSKPTALNPQVVEVTTRFLNQQGGRSKPQITRTVIANNYALVNWMRGAAGGQALLQRQVKDWEVIDWGGGAMNRATLTALGVPPELAVQLLKGR